MAQIQGAIEAVVRTLHRYWVEWWWLDFVVASVAVVAPAVVIKPGTGIDLLGRVDLEVRRSIYTDLLQLAVIFAGFGGVAFAVYLGMSSKAVTDVRRRLGQKLLTTWLVALLTPWLSALVLVVAKATDRGGLAPDSWARWAAFGAVVLVVAQLLRITWVFYQLAMIELAPPRPARPTGTRPIEVVRSGRAG